MDFLTTTIAINEQILSTNDVPSNSEVPDIQSSLENVLASLEEVDTRIIELEATLAGLELRRSELQQMANARKGALSLIRRLPNEILSEILLFAIGRSRKHDGYYEPVDLKANKPQWVYSHVCVRWRAVVLALPVVWSNISVLEPAYSSSASDILQTILTRSNHHPLCIYYASETIHLFNTLVSSASVWRHAFLRIGAHHIYYSTMRNVKGNLPILESLDLLPITPNDFFRLPNYFEHAPQLKRVSVSQVSGVASLRLPWSQLTHFECDSFFSPEEELEILEKLPNLVSFKPGEWGLAMEPPSDLQLNHLREIRLGPLGAGMLKHLTLPALETIETWFDPDHVKEICALIQRSSCSIKSLTLRSSGNPLRYVLESISDSLQSINSITTLQVEGTWLSTALLEYLRVHTSHYYRPCFYPNLETLCLELEDKGVTVSALRDVINSRRRAFKSSHGVVRELKNIVIRRVLSVDDGLDLATLQGDEYSVHIIHRVT